MISTKTPEERAARLYKSGASAENIIGAIIFTEDLAYLDAIEEEEKFRKSRVTVLRHIQRRRAALGDSTSKFTAYALRYLPTGKFIERKPHPGQVRDLTVACLFNHSADASFCRSQLRGKDYYDCDIHDIEVVKVDVALGVTQ